MKVSAEWINKALRSPRTVEQIETALVATGTEVDQVTHIPDGIVVAKVVSVEPVPKSTKGVQITQIFDGSTTIQVLTGAPNVAVGQRVAWAAPGVHLPGWDAPLAIRSMFGMPSHGMLCSEIEVGIGTEADGIMVLASGEPGDPLSSVVELPAVLDVDVTTNRPDLLNHFGLASEVDTYYGEWPTTTSWEEQPVALDDVVDVHVEDPLDTLRFTAIVVDGVDPTVPSPPWMVRLLEQVGLRSIDPIVDVTNYVPLFMGQPLHAFDALALEKLGGSLTLSARRARTGEKLITLDGVERELSPDDVVVATGAVPLSLAGIFGGSESGVVGTTRRIVLEAATWNRTKVRASCSRHALRTDASFRFDKGLPRVMARSGLFCALSLLREMFPDMKCGPVVDLGGDGPPLAPVVVPDGFFSRLLGFDVPAKRAHDILARLGCAVLQFDKTIHVTPPLIRPDLSRPEDLAEEVGRMIGYGAVPSRLPGTAPREDALLVPERVAKVATHAMLGHGCTEIITFSFHEPGGSSLLPGLGEGKTVVSLRNPMSADMGEMRTSLLPALAHTVAMNQHRSVPHISLFEIGRVFWQELESPVLLGDDYVFESVPRAPLPHEPLIVGAARSVEDAQAAAGEIRALIARFVRLAEDLGTRDITVVAGSGRGLRARRCAALMCGDNRVGIVGEIEASVAHTWDIRGRVVVGELSVDAMMAQRRAPLAYEAPSKAPAVLSDLAVTVAMDAHVGDALAVMKRCGGELLERVELYDEYKGEPLAADSKGWSFHLTFRDPERTLTREQADEMEKSLLEALATSVGATRR